MLFWAHFGCANRRACPAPTANRESSPDGAGRHTCAIRGDLNLKEAGKGRKSPASNLPPLDTLAEVDFNSFRPPDLTIKAIQAASLSRGAGSQYHTGGPAI